MHKERIEKGRERQTDVCRNKPGIIPKEEVKYHCTNHLPPV
jgi:hypothetical protein